MQSAKNYEPSKKPKRAHFLPPLQLEFRSNVNLFSGIKEVEKCQEDVVNAYDQA